MTALSPAHPAPTVTGAQVRRGTPEYRRIGAALFLTGFSAFSLIYCAQPLLTAFTREFHVTPAQSALSLSLTTGCLAVSILIMSAVADSFSRRRVMLTSLLAAALLNGLAALAPTWNLLLLCRALEGLALGGVPAVAMAYLAEEIHPRDLGAAMGQYVGGTAFGGMMGRVCIGLLAGVTSWHAALLVMAGAGLLSAAGFALLLPPSRGFQPRPAAPAREHLRRWAAHLRTPGLGALFTLGFLNLGVMVAAFNYLGFRLHAPPYALSAAAISLIFLTYLLGSAASGWGGRTADRRGRRPLLTTGLTVSSAGLALTLLRPLPVIILGVTLITVGFFVTHSVASSSVGQLARRDKGHASALYLLAYYAGSSVVGVLGGAAWAAGGWLLLVALCAALLGLGLTITRQIPRG